MNLLQESWFTEFSANDLQKIKKKKNSQKPLDNENTDMCMMKVNGKIVCSPWTGQAFSLAVEKVLFKGKSKYQDVLVFKSKTYGNVLVLDGVIQTTDRDEFAYQEMLAHLPLFAHPNPKKILIIGGGDGGILREVIKHKCVESVTMCEIDEMVIDVAKKFLPNLSKSFSHPKLNLYIGDGFEFLKNHQNEYDVVITDSSDPIGPAEVLFSQHFYSLVNNSLKNDGILSSQAESPWLHLSLIAKLIKFAREIFPSVQYAFSTVPTYPSGTMGYLLASKTKLDLSEPARRITYSEAKTMELKFYNAETHKAAFVLPNFVREGLVENDAH